METTKFINVHFVPSLRM